MWTRADAVHPYRLTCISAIATQGRWRAAITGVHVHVGSDTRTGKFGFASSVSLDNMLCALTRGMYPGSGLCLTGHDKSTFPPSVWRGQTDGFQGHGHINDQTQTYPKTMTQIHLKLGSTVI